MMASNHAVELAPPVKASPASRLTQKWGGIACFVLAVSTIMAPAIYLFGNLRDRWGPWTYDLADFLYGPLWSASLMLAVFAMYESLRERAPRRMTLALLAAGLAALAIVAVALIRSSNRHYHLVHPELHLEGSPMVLTVWTTMIAGLTSVGRHFAGWTLLLIGSAGWTTRDVPRALSGLYLVAGIPALFAYLLPDPSGAALGVFVAIWQGILLLRWARAAEHTIY